MHLLGVVVERLDGGGARYLFALRVSTGEHTAAAII